MTDKSSNGEPKLETGISYLLIIGVIISLLLEIIGMILFYNSYGHLVTVQDINIFIQGHNFFGFVLEQFQGKFIGGNAFLFMTSGIIILILTPYIRVIASVIYFGWQKNIQYVLITFFVLVVITLSLALH